MYYKDDTHYFVMTAKKQSLLEKGVILQVTTQRQYFTILNSDATLIIIFIV